MRAKLTILFVVLLLSSFSAISQNTGPDLRQELQDKHIEVINEKALSNKNIEGSPYLTEDYLPSKIHFQNQDKVYTAELRYNAYSDEFEFTQGGYRFAIANKEEIDSIEYMGYDFVYTSYTNKNGRSVKRFLVRLANGPCSLYKTYTINFREEEPPRTGYDEYQPPRFEEEDPTYFIKMKNDTKPELIKSFRRGRFLNRFGSLENELKQYMRNNNLRPRREEDLIRFIRYYNKNYGKK